MPEMEKPKVPWWQPHLALFWRLSVWIGGPVIAAVFLGKFLDRKFNSEPWLFLFSVGVAFVVSMIALVYEGLKEMRKIDQGFQNKSEARNPKSETNSNNKNSNDKNGFEF